MTTASIEAQHRTRAFARVIGPTLRYSPRSTRSDFPELTQLITDVYARPAGAFALGAAMLAASLVIVGGHRGWRGPAAVTVSLFGWFVAVRRGRSSKPAVSRWWMSRPSGC